mgnify:CR=1 FL=1|tara:strand:- start:19 stop:345 length:327 start_codon:yes stop_codon:yes gene_type:complete
MSDKIFPKGIFFQKKDYAPSYVIGSISIKIADAIPFLQQNENGAGYVNIDILTAKETNKPYCLLNTYVKQEAPKVVQEAKAQENLNNLDSFTQIEYPNDDIDPESIPF